MPGLYFSLRQRTVLILLITNPSPPILFNSPPFLFFPLPFLFFSNLYCLMNSTFLRILAISSKTDFCNIPTLCDIPNFFKLHFKSLGMDPSSPLIIAAINVSLSHILAISNRSSEYLCSFSFPFRISSLSTGQTQPYVRTTFHIHLLHTSCIILQLTLKHTYRIFSCTPSVLTYRNHSPCAEHSPHVFHIICT